MISRLPDTEEAMKLAIRERQLERAAPVRREREKDEISQYSQGDRRLRIAYLTTEYPKTSHTFIRREIIELERRGHSVLRVALRCGAIADEQDRKEAAHTLHLLARSRAALILSATALMVMRPAHALRTLRMALQMGCGTERGMLRHLAYAIEAAALAKYLRREQIRHVHVHFGTNVAAVARLMKCFVGISYSFTVHGPDEFDAPRALRLREKVADAEFVIAISDFGASQLRRWTDLADWDRIHVVRCSVGEAFLSAEQPVDATSRTLVCVGRLCPQKGQLLLLDAAARLNEAGVDFRLVLAGDGELRSVIETRIRALAIQDRVTITGWIDEAQVREQLHQARAMVLPSFAEGLPVVIMEALALGRPVISTAIAGIPELVKDDECGWLIPAGNLDELVRAMREALDAPAEHLGALGRAGAERVRQRHCTRTEVGTLESLLLRHVDNQQSANVRCEAAELLRTGKAGSDSIKAACPVRDRVIAHPRR